MTVQEVQYHTVHRKVVEDANGAVRTLYHVDGFAPMTWPELLAMFDKQAEDIRDNDETRRAPQDVQ